MRTRLCSVLVTLLCAGCYLAHWPKGSPQGQNAPPTGSGASRATGPTAVPSRSPDASCAHVEQVSAAGVDKVDLLFVVDNSDSMGEEQVALRKAFPRLIDVLISGDRDADGVQDFPPPKDLHLGVVSSDMGLPGVQGIQNCQGLGQDGLLQHAPHAGVDPCQASYPPFLSFANGSDDPQRIAIDFACIATLGTGGCGFEHQLEAGLKALWPSKDPMPDPKTHMNRLTFLTDPATGVGKLGHGDVENSGFLRSDPQAGVSLIGIIVLSDEDDCSASDTTPFMPPQFLNPGDPVAMQGMNVRCHYNQKALYPVERYVTGFKALRPGVEPLVVFGAITGVPPDLVSPEALAKVDFSNAKQRERFYSDLLADSRMKEVIDDRGTPDPSDDRLKHSCMSSGGTADPPIRIVQVARGFGANGIVQSICQPDFSVALNVIVAQLGARLATRCVSTL